MEVLYGICSGVDVHKKLLVVCLRSGRKTEIRSFGTTTQELFDIAQWLKDNHGEMAAMESTGSYSLALSLPGSVHTAELKGLMSL